jgi:hypothetical protein
MEGMIVTQLSPAKTSCGRELGDNHTFHPMQTSQIIYNCFSGTKGHHVSLRLGCLHWMEGMIVTQLSPAKTSVAGVFATKISTTNNNL